MSESREYIWKKMLGNELTKDEIYSIIDDIKNDRLTRLEMSLFLYAQELKGMNDEEVENLTRAIADSGEKIHFDETVYDKHSIGGVPGNKVSLLIVPIIASYNLLIPKTSSKAITSASGTADVAEVLMPVDFSAEEFKRIAYKTKGTIVHGGALNVAPVDDILISKVQHPLGDEQPYTQMLASIMAKKLTVGANYVVIDIPVGGLKVNDRIAAKKMARDFKRLGKRLGMEVKCLTTYGGQPVGRAIGPALEAKEALEALYRKHSYFDNEEPFSLTEKATDLAGLILKMSGKVPSRQIGKKYAEDALASGRALKKMKEIIEEQGGNPNIRPEDIPIAQNKITIYSLCKGYIKKINNSLITKVARTAGAPSDKTAGIFLYAKEGAKIKKGDAILEIYADKESKLTEAYNMFKKTKPVSIEGMALDCF